MVLIPIDVPSGFYVIVAWETSSKESVPLKIGLLFLRPGNTDINMGFYFSSAFELCSAISTFS